MSESSYKTHILEEIDDLPEHYLPTVYRMVHLLGNQEKDGDDMNTKTRISLYGLWKGSVISETSFKEARKAVIRHEVNGEG